MFRAAVAAQVLSMSLGLAFPWLMGHLVDAALPSVNAARAGWRPGVDEVALWLAATLLGQAVLTFLYSAAFHSAGQRAVALLRQRLFGRLLRLPMRFHAEHRVGELSSRLGSDMSILEDVYCGAVPQAIRQGMLLAGGMTAIFLTSPKLAGLMIGSLPVLVGVAVIFGRSVRRVWRAAQERLAVAGTVAEESLHGIAGVKAFGNEDLELRRYGAAVEEWLAAVMRGARRRAGLIAFVIAGIFGSIVLVLWYGAKLMQAGELSHGDLTRFTLYMLFVGGGVSSLAEVLAALQKGAGVSSRVRELLALAPEDSGAGAAMPGRAAAVTLEDVHFRYPSRPEAPVLRGLSLEARAGERIALVGPSGAGKSTVVSLLLRFYEPESGRILLDGTDTRALPLAAVRGRMAMVPQEVLLFGGSLRENIAYGRPCATDAEVEDAARRANCEEFIRRFPDGWETLVGERGVKLSGGQRQRIAIARAFLRDPALLLLDEATSALDSEGEALVQDALDTLLAGRTAIIIAHRLATVRKCDRIYVIEEGRVTQAGTHEELMAMGGRYRRLAELQFTEGA